MSLPGRFLSRCSFTLCITMEVEPRIAKQYEGQHCCSSKNYRGKGMEGGKKVFLRRFLADQKIASSWGGGGGGGGGRRGGKRFRSSNSTSNKLLLVSRHILTTGLQKCL